VGVVEEAQQCRAAGTVAPATALWTVFLAHGADFNSHVSGR